MSVPFVSRVAISLLLVALTTGVSLAQDGDGDLGSRGTSLTLSDFLVGFLRDGITLAPPSGGISHEAHFIASDSPQLLAVQQLNGAIGRQIASVPLSSSAGGFAFSFDAATGLVTRPTQSFGPVFAERPLTIGDGRFNLGLNYSQYTFDSYDDISLRQGDMVLVFTHEDTNEDGSNESFPFEGDIIESIVFLNIGTSVTSFVATYGVTDALDLAVAIPRVEVDMQISVDSEVKRLATGESSTIHQFTNGSPRQVVVREASASGVGDVTVRAKARIAGDPDLRTVLGVALETRIPTGDELNLLGTGEWLVRGMLLASTGTSTLSAHVNAGYGYGTGDLSDDVVYTAGVDWAADPKLTLSADVVGRYALETVSVGVGPQAFTYVDDESGLVESSTFSRLSGESNVSRNTASVALGMKLNIHGNFIVTANGLLPATSEGLRDDFASLVGIDYSF